MPSTQGPRALSESERLAWLRLARSENVGPVTFFRLLERFGSAAAAIEALPRLAEAAGRPLAPAPPGAAERELEAYERLGARLVARGEPDYPERLAAIVDPPPVIAVRGEIGLIGRDAVALVGARNASAAGQRIAEGLAGALGQAGLVVASGLARGIDAAAHRGALETGTVAVLAGGVDRAFPPENAKLYEEILELGAVVAELPPGIEPRAKHFPRRNRIIAGLSLGTVVIEAALRSGSLLTARMALDEGRELFAVPGSPLDPRCRGCNDLIRRGEAALVETAEDVLTALSGMLGARTRRIRPRRRREASVRSAPAAPALPPGTADSPDGAREAVLSALGPTPVSVDELVRRCQLSPAIVSSVLLDLELAGHLERHPGQCVSLA